MKIMIIKKIKEILDIKRVKKTLKIPVLVLMLCTWTGCPDDPEDRPKPPPEPEPWIPVKINLEADILSLTTVKSSNDDDKVGLFMKKNQQYITTPDALFPNAVNLPTSISGKALIPSEELFYPEDGSVDFIAYYPYNASASANLTIETTMPADQTEGLPEETLYSRNATNRQPSAAPVMLNFRHSFVKIVIHTVMGQFIEATPDFPGMTATIEGAGDEEAGWYTQGTLQLKDGIFTGLQNKQPVKFRKTAHTETTASFEAFVLPCEIEDGEIRFVFTMLEEDYIYVLKAGIYDGAMQYEFNLKISELETVLMGSKIVPRTTVPVTPYLNEPAPGSVTTLMGYAGSANNLVFGPFGMAQLDDCRYMACDRHGRIFVVNNNGASFRRVHLVDLNTNAFSATLVTQYITGDPNVTRPAVHPNGDIIYVPWNTGNTAAGVTPAYDWRDMYFECNTTDPEMEWEEKKFNRPPSNEPKYFTLNTNKHSMAYCPYDDYIYFVGNVNGGVHRFNPATGYAEWISIEHTEQNPVDWNYEHIEDGSRWKRFYFMRDVNGERYLTFDPNEPYMMYGAINVNNANAGTPHLIYRLDVRTGDGEIFAGSHSATQSNNGFLDGSVTNAKFYSPRGLAFDLNGDLLIADLGNHCIRKIDMKTKMVTTYAGTPWKGSGYRDDYRMSAMFSSPSDLCVDPRDGAVYVLDNGNRMIRKIWPENN